MDLSIQNPWWRTPAAIEEDEKVKEANSKSPMLLRKIDVSKNLIFLGPRQIGKTTSIKLTIQELLKHMNPRNILYFSCEPLDKKNDIIEIIKEFDRVSPSGKKIVFLDEVTQIKGWELAIKYIIETELSKNKVVIATGSNAMLLKMGYERLPGRNIRTTLYLPLSFREFIMNFGSDELKKSVSNSKLDKFSISDVARESKKLLPFLGEINRMLHIYLKTGGYPKTIYEFFEKGKIEEETYEIFVKWILGDLNRLDKKEHIFKSMVRGIIKNYCSKFSLHSFSKEMEISSHSTVSDYLDVLQSLLLVNNLYQVDLSKQLPVFRKERKCYFLDPLFYSVFSGYIYGKYRDYSEENESKILEGVVCEALSRMKRKYLDISGFLWFFTKNRETDFVFKDDFLFGIELKWKENVEPKDFSNFHSFKHKLLLSKSDFHEGEILTVPVGIFLAIL